MKIAIPRTSRRKKVRGGDESSSGSDISSDEDGPEVRTTAKRTKAAPGPHRAQRNSTKVKKVCKQFRQENWQR